MELPAYDKIKADFPKASFNRMLTQRFFVTPSFEIYGGVAGLYDLGPPGTAIKANILSFWRNHFVLTENMLEVDCVSVTPEPVLTASGHTAKFTDLMVKDLKNGSCYRADHLLEQHLDKLLEQKDLDPKKRDEYKTVQAQADAYSKEEMAVILKQYGVKAPETNNDLSDPEPFNLMFQTSIGPTGHSRGFLRPETAQGIFVNFKRLLEFNGGKLPFAAAQIGQAYRNEIAPRSGLLRVREFTLAEIEHFVNPEDKSHPKFASVAHVILNMFPRDIQVTTKQIVQIPIGEAVQKGVVANETLGYFIVRTFFFLIGCGIKPERLRFRQHLKDEMAHYACDCWDAEIHTSYGWVECVGIADRSAFDLSAHSIASKQPLSAFIEFKEGSKVVDAIDITVDKSKVGKSFKGKAQTIIQYLSELSPEDTAQMQQAFANNQPGSVTVGGETFEITPDLVQFKKVQKKVTGQHITPGVIEPSFGIGRILYAVLEHAYWVRPDDAQRAVLSLPPAIAPVKVSVLPLLQNDNLNAFIPKLAVLLTNNGISFKTDDTGQSIGKRYARTDEIGIPFGITVDFDTINDSTVTLRERDTTAQVRIKIDEVPMTLLNLIRGVISWSEVQQKYPKYEPKE